MQSDSQKDANRLFSSVRGPLRCRAPWKQQAHAGGKSAWCANAAWENVPSRVKTNELMKQPPEIPPRQFHPASTTRPR